MKIDRLMKNIPHEIIQIGNDPEITNITEDTRDVAPGTLFVCLRGFRVDGHSFINHAVETGAAAILIDSIQNFYPDGITVVKVDNTRMILCALASNFYENSADSLNIIGVTGTNGKTSVTHFIETVISESGRTVGLIGSIGTRLGNENIDVPFKTATTPDPIELHKIFYSMREKKATEVVMEVSSHALALHKLKGLHFHTGVFTNLTQDHLDFHGSMENYREAKSRLFVNCKYGVVNADDVESSYFMTRTANKCIWLTYGIDTDCDLRAAHIEYINGGTSFDVEIDGATENFYLPVKGRFNVYNALAAISAALSMNISVETIRRGISLIKSVPGRMQSVENNKNVHIIVDYAHTPDGLINIINAVRGFAKGKIITVFGCGGGRDKSKRPIMGRIAGTLSDFCIITSDNPRTEDPDEIISQVEAGIKETACRYSKERDRKKAIEKGLSMIEAEDAIIIAGKGHETYQVIGENKIPFSDAEIVKDFLL